MDGRQRPETAGDSAVVFKTSATLRKAKCQLRLTRSGMPSRVSLRRHWIFSKLKARFDRFENHTTISTRFCVLPDFAGGRTAESGNSTVPVVSGRCLILCFFYICLGNTVVQ